MKHRLRLLAAWIAPLWFLQTPWAWQRVAKAESLLNRKWQVRFGRHHYSRSPSLRTALVAALKKLDKPTRAAPKPPAT